MDDGPMKGALMLKRLILLALVVTLPGCGSLLKLGGEARFGGGTGEPTVEEVVVIVRNSGDVEAEKYLLKRGVSDAGIMLLIARAKDAIQRERDKCLGQETCGL